MKHPDQPSPTPDSHLNPGGHNRPETAATVPEPAGIHPEAHDIAPLLERIAADATGALGDNLVSLVMYGSHPRGEPRPSSDVNLMIFVRDASAKAMSNLLAQAQAWTKEGATAPVVITVSEFERSQDTLALEYLDIAASRQILAGEDVFAEFAPDWKLVRLALEQEARRKAIILMKRWMATAGNARDARRIISDTIPGYVAVLRAMILYERRAVSILHAQAVLSEFNWTRGLDPAFWKRVYDVGKEYEGTTTEQITELMATYIDQTQALVQYLDGLGEKS
jgi:hypothetical protein